MTTFRPAIITVSMLTLLAGLSAGCGSSQQFTAGRLPYGSGQAAAMRDPFLAQPPAGGPKAVAAAQPAAGGYGTAPAGNGMSGSPAAQPPAGMAQATPYDPTTNLRHYNRQSTPGASMPAAQQAFASAAAPAQGQSYPSTAPVQPGAVPNYPQNGVPYQTAYLQQPADSNPFAVPASAGQPAAMPAGPPPQATGQVQQMSYEMPANYQMPARVRDPNPFAEVEGQSISGPTMPQYQAMPQINPAGRTDAWVPQTTRGNTSQAFLPPSR